MENKEKTARLKVGTFRIKILLLIIAVILVSFSLIEFSLLKPSSSLLINIIMALFSIAAIVYAFLTTQNYLRDMSKVYNAVKEMRLGHTGVRCGIKSKNEIGMMAAEFDALFDYIQNVLIGTVKNIAAGNVDNIDIEIKDEHDDISPALNNTASIIRSLSHDLRHMIEAANNGNLQKRCDTSKYSGSWKILTDDMNGLLDSISTPLDEIMTVLGLFAVNDFTHLIKGKYTGSFVQLGENINIVRNNMLQIQGAIVRVAQGNTSRLEAFGNIGKKSENDYMIPSVIKLMETVQALISEVTHLTEECSKGNIREARGDASKFQGGFMDIITGFNNTLDAVVEPISEAASVLSAISLNDLTVALPEDKFNGDFEVLLTAVNGVRARLETLQDIAIAVSNGDISELDKFKSLGKRSVNDRLVPAFVKMMESIKALITETTAFAKAAEDGDLSYSSKAEGLEGEYALIVRSFNNAFASMSVPLRELSEVMAETAAGSLHSFVQGEYKGNYKILSDDFNNTVKIIGKYSSQVAYILTEFSKGNLDLKNAEGYLGDWVDIQNALNSIIDTMNELLCNIYTASEQVASGSKQVSQGSQNLSQGAAEQASSIEQLTASISDISSQTRNNAESAVEANKLAILTKENASLGNKQMQELLISINAINESSDNISKIIKVIDEIAFQTNILSLNAAVEAARAGEFGKGFAVVADEVRSLAARSAKASKSTAELIENSVKNIESGTAIANETAAALSKIVKNVDKVTAIVANISIASVEQANGISQIDRGIEVVSNVVQTNSATAEESAAASEELSSQAEYLKEMILRFTLR